MIKPTHIYKAISEAIDAWGDRNYINARSHLAQALGLRGKNAAIQLSNILNYKSYNPVSPKAMKLGQLSVIMDELDQEGVAHILNGIGDPHGLMVVPKKMDVADHENFHKAADDAMLESDDVFKATKLALRDETLTDDELKAIIKEIDESESATAKLKAMAKERLRKMEEEG